MPGGKILVLVVVLGCQASATEYTERRTRKVYDINYRQVEAPMLDIPQPTTSINPWPHPAGGAPAPNPASPHPPPPPPAPAPPPPPPTTSTPQLLISPIPPSTIASTAVSASTSTSTTPTAAPATGIISITALPPLDPSAVPTYIAYPKKKPSEQGFKLVYLAPLFAVLGILWGSVTAWLTYGCLTRRPRVREAGEELVGGPQYVPAGREEGQGAVGRERGAGRGDLEGGALLRNADADDGMHEAVFEWPDLREKDRLGIEMENENEKRHDPFLALPQSTPAKPRSTRTKSAHSTLTAYSDATYLLDTDHDDDSKKGAEEVPWESLRHQSIRRGILEQVQREGHRIDALRPVAGSLLRKTAAGTGTAHQNGAERRPARHARTDSDLLVGDVNLPLLLPDRAALRSKESACTSSTSGSRPLSHRADSTYTTLSVDSSYTASTGDKTQWRPGAGFRIVAESPAPSREPTPTPANVSPEDAYPAPPASGSTPLWGGSDDVDRYTPLPVRHASRGNSASNSPVKGALTTPDRTRRPHQPQPQPHANVLPQSPPQITSPLLEHRLCFTPTPASPPGIRTRTRAPGGTPANTPARSDRDRDHGRARQPLQFPVDLDINSPRPDMYSARLVKAPPLKSRPPMASKTSSSGSAVSYTRDAEGRAFRKVEDIMQSGWGARGEEGVPSLSPTGFGRRGGA